ncbi:hypothetical protein SAMN05192574_11937 [Mucilaginibacter gossypiicola]|uniref:Uncharacterized protein n=1 Tax=Mucilaginibacter gossypiicola TaxID=551995 RepID=A0A1H8UGS0_9SPHI|nr:hypothetical protein SAMN05192574_11937 [Mucilaginibacter gossypiicola]
MGFVIAIYIRFFTLNFNANKNAFNDVACSLLSALKHLNLKC